MPTVQLKLIEAWKELADHTLPDCLAGCQSFKDKPFRCCEPLFCDMARDHALEHWNETLVDSRMYKEGKTNLPFMGENGCTIAPHLRPSCTLHHCQINSLGIKIGDAAFTDKYFTLRNKISDLEMEKYESNQVS